MSVDNVSADERDLFNCFKLMVKAYQAGIPGVGYYVSQNLRTRLNETDYKKLIELELQYKFTQTKI
jgi:hypothetical protein